MLPELGIGDAYGAGFEYAESDFVSPWFLTRGSQLLRCFDSLSELLQDCIAYTGDVDTVAARTCCCL